MGEKDPTVFLQQRNMLYLNKQRLYTHALHGRLQATLCHNTHNYRLYFSPKASVAIQKRHPYTGNLISETPGDSKTAFLHRVLGPCRGDTCLGLIPQCHDRS